MVAHFLGIDAQGRPPEGEEQGAGTGLVSKIELRATVEVGEVLVLLES